MSNFRWMFLSVCVGLMTSCATTQQSAPIEDRATGVRPASLYEGKPGYHVVKPGETVMQLSRNTGYKPADIIAWNNLAKPNELKVGQVLRIAPPGNDSAATTMATTTSAAADAQSGAASSRSVEMTPLFPAGSTVAPANAANAANAQTAPQAAVMNKTGPRGDKQPYSDNTLTAMQQQPDYGAPLAAASSAQPAAKTTALQTTAMQTASPKIASQQVAASQTSGNALAASNAGLATWKWPADGKQLSGFVENKSKGIDIAGTMGQPVRVAADGKVTHVGPLRGYGNMVIVKHNESLNTVYAHNKSILVKEGDVVKQGQQIAEMGNSDSDMVKLRFEVRQHGKPVDPSKFLPQR